MTSDFEAVEWPKYLRMPQARIWAGGLNDDQVRYAATQWRRSGPVPWNSSKAAMDEYRHRGLG
jgi:hypothetical protein